jgi:[ribosomal protein S18]-alanine N-acetyltransferase
MLIDWIRRPEWRIGPPEFRHVGEIEALHAMSFARGWSGEEIEGLLSDRTVYADVVSANAGMRPIEGFVLSRIVADEAEILSIAVHPRRRRMGAARRLLDAHLHRLDHLGARRVVLEVDEVNAPAIALYRAYRFAEVGRRPAYYTRADGSRGMGLIMARPLG